MPDQYEDYDDERVDARSRLTMWAVILGVVVLCAAGGLYLREADANRDIPGYAGHTGVLRVPVDGQLTIAGEQDAVGTSAREEALATDSPAVIKEVETITGSVDGHELIGRRVDFHVPVLDRANDIAFWVGSQDNRLLVVMDRDHRDSATRQRGAVGSNEISPVHAGQQADIVGTIQKMPKAEEMYSWNLTTTDKKELADRPIYVSAESVTTEERGE
jgi:hypothetical protein